MTDNHQFNWVLNLVLDNVQMWPPYLCKLIKLLGSCISIVQIRERQREGASRAEYREWSTVGTGRQGGSQDVSGGLPSLARSPCWHHCQAPPPNGHLASNNPWNLWCYLLSPLAGPWEEVGSPCKLLSAYSGPEMDFSGFFFLPCDKN